MTGLPNRRLFEQDLTSALGRAAQGGGGLLHVFLDIDNLKQVNDRFGHHVGDILIRAVAGLLEALRRPGQVLPVAECTGLMRVIDLMVVALMGVAVAHLHAVGLRIRVSVNLSPDSLQQAQLG